MKKLFKGIIPSLALLFAINSFNSSSNNIYAKGKLVHPSWSKNAVIYEVNIRQYTPEGSFNALEARLPELKKMGVDILWLMPINPIGIFHRKGELGSYYSVSNYKAVNPEFGTIGTFRHLIEKIHELKMHVIIDWVANHTSWDNIWTRMHPDFYVRNDSGKFVPPVADWTDVIKLNYNNRELRDSMYSAMEYWVKDFDIDGFRCDVADMVPTDFWISVRRKLDKIKKVFMLAEADKNYLHQAFDMTYNWPLKDLMNDVAKGKKTASDIVSYFEKEKKEYKPDDYRMVFTSNHDENSWNGSAVERLGAGVKAFAVLCGTVKGMPLIYSGQEAGQDKRLRFFDKDTIDWKPSPMRDFYTKLDSLKIVNHALWNGTAGGEMKFIKTGNENVLAFVREKGNNKVFAIFNLCHEWQKVKLKSDLIKGEFNDLFGGNQKTKFESEASFDLTPWDCRVYSK